MVRVLLGALLLFSLFRTGLSLLCYVCDASEDPSCGDLSTGARLRFRYLDKCKSFADEDGKPLGRPLCYKTSLPGGVRRGCLSTNPRACLMAPCHVCDSNFCNGSASRRNEPLLLCAMLPALTALATRNT